jgi:homoserine dehydrogenase
VTSAGAPISRRIILVGLGNVGRNFLRVLDSQAPLLRERHGIEFMVVGAADSAGAAFDNAGLDRGAVLAAKERGDSVGSLPRVGHPGMSALELLRSIRADAMLESTPVDLRTGQPGLDIVRTALRQGAPVVLANKGPLALAYSELAALSDLADSASPALRFSACVGGALPTINLGVRDLAGVRILRVEAVLNGTTQHMLRAMEQGRDYAEVLADAKQRGLTETDPSLDVDGWDAAFKLVILANAVLRQPATVADVEVEGIGRLTPQLLEAAAHRGERIVLLCLAEPIRDRAGSFRLSVAPTALSLDHPLARMDGDEMGVVYHTDIAGRASATSLERDPVPTASAMLRDLLEIADRQPLG